MGQAIVGTGSHQPIAPLDVTAAAATGTLTVNLIDTGGIGGHAALYLVTRDQATGQPIESQLLFPARVTFTSTTPLGTPLVVASTTLPTTAPVANGTVYYHQDGLGTVTDLTDGTGRLVKSYAYDAYGNMLESPGTVDQPYTYTGREFDAETGLYYYRARYYDAGTGRFLQKDPIGLRGGLNLYRYVGADPANWIDSTGLTRRDKTYGLPSDFWKWYHRQVKRPGDPDVNQGEAHDLYEEWKRQGRPDADGHRVEPDKSSEENNPFGYCPLKDPVPPVMVVPAPDDAIPDYLRPFYSEEPANSRMPRIPGRMIFPGPRFIVP